EAERLKERIGQGAAALASASSSNGNSAPAVRRRTPSSTRRGIPSLWRTGPGSRSRPTPWRSGYRETQRCQRGRSRRSLPTASPRRFGMWSIPDRCLGIHGTSLLYRAHNLQPERSNRANPRVFPVDKSVFVFIASNNRWGVTSHGPKPGFTSSTKARSSRPFISAILLTISAACATAPPRETLPTALVTRTGDVHDFDYFAGAWTTHQRRLK